MQEKDGTILKPDDWDGLAAIHRLHLDLVADFDLGDGHLDRVQVLAEPHALGHRGIGLMEHLVEVVLVLFSEAVVEPLAPDDLPAADDVDAVVALVAVNTGVAFRCLAESPPQSEAPR